MTNPLTLLPALWRTVLYVAYALLGPVLIYTASRGWTGEAEYALYVGVGTAFGLVAASNVTLNTEGRDPYDVMPAEVELVDETGSVNVVQLAAVLVIIVCIVWLVLLIV